MTCNTEFSSKSPCPCYLARVKGLGGSKDPRAWAPPKQFDGEADEKFGKRLAEWKSKRAMVAKRLGVKLE